MVLADFQIAANCVKPVGYVYSKTNDITYPTGLMTLEEIERDMAVRAQVYPGEYMFSLFDPDKHVFKPLIEPFHPDQVRAVEDTKVISYGCSSYGYDLRCADEFKVFTNINSTIVDPKNFDEGNFVDVSGKGFCIIPPNSFALARSVERFAIPRNVLTVCLGKSTYARCGIIVNVTPLEPEWEGYVTLEFSNTTPLPAKVYANEGVAQVIFLTGEPCHTSYADRKGKYQGQVGVTLPKL